MEKKSRDVLSRLEELGCDNLWPRFAQHVDGANVLMAEVIDDEVVLTPAGEALVKSATKKTKEPAVAAVTIDAPVPAE
jgi:hypothetical protein